MSVRAMLEPNKEHDRKFQNRADREVEHVLHDRDSVRLSVARLSNSSYCQTVVFATNKDKFTTPTKVLRAASSKSFGRDA
jgi:ribosomal protein L18